MYLETEQPGFEINDFKSCTIRTIFRPIFLVDKWQSFEFAVTCYFHMPALLYTYVNDSKYTYVHFNAYRKQSKLWHLMD